MKESREERTSVNFPAPGSGVPRSSEDILAAGARKGNTTGHLFDNPEPMKTSFSSIDRSPRSVSDA